MIPQISIVFKPEMKIINYIYILFIILNILGSNEVYFCRISIQFSDKKLKRQ